MRRRAYVHIDRAGVRGAASNSSSRGSAASGCPTPPPQVVTPSHILEKPMPTLDAERERLFDDLISELADRVRHAPAEAQARRSGHGRPPERERGSGWDRAWAVSAAAGP